MAPIKSSLARSVAKLLGISKDTDLTLRGATQITRFVPPPPVSASGGVTSGGIAPGNGYRYHVFVSPGNFVVSQGGDIEILAIAAGGNGGVHQPSSTSVGYTSGGGAGGIFHVNPYPIEPGTHPVTVAAQGTTPDSAMIQPGGDTTFVDANGPTTLTAKGGGHGGYYGNSAPPGSPGEWARGGEGGSGGGNCYGSAPEPFGTVGPAIQPAQNPGIANLTNYGNNGGAQTPAPHFTGGGGGGGAGAVGQPGQPTTSGAGGDGQPFPDFAAPLIAPEIPSPVRSDWTSEVGPTGLYGGGGGGAGSTNGSYPTHPAQPGGSGGGGDGADGSTTAGSPAAKNGTAYTGGGGGGGGQAGGAKPRGGTGGAGLVVIRYEV